MEFSLNQIAKATGGTTVRADGQVDQPLRIVTDSREATSDTVFWALHGTAHDGHEFVDAALANGAAACVVSSIWTSLQDHENSGTLIEVTDTLQALADLAAWNRQRWPVRVIGKMRVGLDRPADAMVASVYQMVATDVTDTW